jgi:hypothetical protein
MRVMWGVYNFISLTFTQNSGCRLTDRSISRYLVYASILSRTFIMQASIHNSEILNYICNLSIYFEKIA